MRLPEPTPISLVKETVFCGESGVLAKDGGLCGDILYAKNIDPDTLPYLTPRLPRAFVTGFTGVPVAFFSDGNHVCVLTQTDLCLAASVYDRRSGSIVRLPINDATPGSFVPMGAWFAGRLYLPACSAVIDCEEMRSHSMHRSLSGGIALSTLDISLAERNRHLVYFEGMDYSDFWEGEYVSVSYTLTGGRETKTCLMRIVEIQEQYDGIVLEGKDATVLCEAVPGSIRLFDALPKLTGIFTHRNRLYGFSANKIYVSAEGHPTCLGEAALFGSKEGGFTVEAPEEVTGGCVFRDEPLFFTDGAALTLSKASPDTPFADYLPTVGVSPKYFNSVVAVGDKVCYMARGGLAVFDGKEGRVVRPGMIDLSPDSVASTDGRQYYFETAKSGQGRSLYAYEPEKDLLVQVDRSSYMSGFCRLGAALIGIYPSEEKADSSAVTVFTGSKPTPQIIEDITNTDSIELHREQTPQTVVEFGEDLTPGGGFGPFSLLLDAELGKGASITLKLFYDGESEAAVVKTLSGEQSRSRCVMRLLPRRCKSYRLVLEGSGEYTVFRLATQWLE